MKKTLTIIFSLFVLIALTACGNKTVKTEQNQNTTEQNQNTNASANVVESDNYKFELPEGFTEEKVDENLANIRKWTTSEDDNTESSILAYEVGHSTYVNDELPKTFEEYSNSDEKGVKTEEVYFNYNDNEDYEEFVVIAKTTYSEGSMMYDMAKTATETDNSELDPEGIVKYNGTKIIVKKSDRSQVISLVVDGNENADTEQMKQILNSFSWK